MRRQPYERVPFQLSMCGSMLETLKTQLRTDDVVKAFDMPVRYIGLPATKQPLDYSAYHKNPAALSFIDEWGVGHKYGSIAH